MNARNTSKAARDSVKGSTKTMQQRIFDFVAAGKRYGATCDEVELETGMRHQSASARIYELRQAGKLANSGTRRKTRSGRTAIVWTLPRYVR